MAEPAAVLSVSDEFAWRGQRLYLAERMRPSRAGWQDQSSQRQLRHQDCLHGRRLEVMNGHIGPLIQIELDDREPAGARPM